MMSGAKSLCARKTENQELNQNYLEPNQKIWFLFGSYFLGTEITEVNSVLYLGPR
jgi:hypothetical protein